MRKILVPTDFSECANYATEVAASIAKKTGARLILMHIINIPSYESNMSIQDTKDIAEGLFMMKLVKKRFKELLEKPFLKDVNVIELVEFDNVYESIAKQAKEQNAGMIVMGSRGSSGAEEVFIGSNTERVIRTAEVPVLTVKSRIENFDIKDIVFASNFYGESYSVFNKVQELAKIYDAKIHLLKVVTPGNFETTRYSRKLIEDFVKETKLKNYDYHIYSDEKVANGIYHFCEETNPDIIAMETHGWTGLKHFLLGSITEGVANHSKLPVLSIKIPKEEEDDGVLFPD
ncbi:universal stress protein [Halocola ammonii]